MILPLESLSPSQRYFSMIQTILPRPVAWVISQSENKSLNLAPFSYFNAVSSAPPIISLSIGMKKDGSEKDTRKNINDREYFTVQIPSVEHAQLVTNSAKPFEAGVSEIQELGLETIEQEGFVIPRLANCKVAYFCKKEKIIEVGDIPQALILGRVEAIYIDDDICEMTDNRLSVDAAKLNPLARLGGNDYAGITQPFSISPS